MSETVFKKLRLITTRSVVCPQEFGLVHRRIFSYLAFRSRIGIGASQREIGRESHTDTRSVRKALQLLHSWGLVTMHEGGWYAVEPTGPVRNWFAPIKSPQFDTHWSDRFCYSRLFLPNRKGRGRRLTINHAHVYSILKSLGRKNNDQARVVERIGPSRLSKILCGLSINTVRTALAVLGQHGLVVSYQEGLFQTLHVLPLNERHVDLFELGKKGIAPPADGGKSLEEVRFLSAEAQAIYKECRREGFPIETARDVTTTARMVGLDHTQFSGHSEIAQIEHAKNRLAGKVNVEHHGNLLLHKLRKIREQQDQFEERMMAETAFQSQRERGMPSIPNSPETKERFAECKNKSPSIDFPAVSQCTNIPENRSALSKEGDLPGRWAMLHGVRYELQSITSAGKLRIRQW